MQRRKGGSPAGGVWAEAVRGIMALRWRCWLLVRAVREVRRRVRSSRRESCGRRNRGMAGGGRPRRRRSRPGRPVRFDGSIDGRGVAISSLARAILGLAGAAGEQSVVADAMEALGQNVQQEAA
jgi:hypothetical protein